MNACLRVCGSCLAVMIRENAPQTQRIRESLDNEI